MTKSTILEVEDTSHFFLKATVNTAAHDVTFVPGQPYRKTLSGKKLIEKLDCHSGSTLAQNDQDFWRLDEKWQWLKLISPSEYDDFASLEKLGEILDNKMIQESKRVV